MRIFVSKDKNVPHIWSQVPEKKLGKFQSQTEGTREISLREHMTHPKKKQKQTNKQTETLSNSNAVIIKPRPRHGASSSSVVRASELEPGGS